MTSARWIWPYNRFHGIRNAHAAFRIDFELDEVAPSVPFGITADQRYMLYVNGAYVGRGPARGFVESWPYDEFDLAPHLRSGHNWIAVRGYSGGVSTFQYVHAASAGMLCWGRAGNIVLDSGSNWRTRALKGYRREIAKLSWQLDFQEYFDAREESLAWVFEENHDTADWGTDQGQIFGYMPWHALEPRGIPPLTADLGSYQGVILRGSGRADSAWSTAENLFHPVWREVREAEFRPERAPADRVTLPAAGQGRIQAAVLDFGRPCFGFLELEIEGPEGAVVDLFYAEGVREDKPIVGSVIDAGCEASMVARVVLGAGRTRYDAFHGVGHRVLTLIARETEAPITVSPRLRETVYPLAVQGEFACDNPGLEAIHRIARQTQRVCMLDAYVDTPWREQAQWWGDARIQAANTFALADDSRLLRRGIRQIGTQEVPNGLTFGHAPTMAYNCVLPDFSLVWMLTHYDLWWQTGDPSLLAEMEPRLQRLLDYFEGEGKGKDGLLLYDPRYWLFLDWADMRPPRHPALLNLWYLLALDACAEVANAANLRVEARLRELGESQREKVDRLLWDEDQGLFCDGTDDAGQRVRRCSVHTQTLAVLAELRPDRHREFLNLRLLPYLGREAMDSAMPSAYWSSYVYQVLEAFGHSAEVVRDIQRRWTPMVPYEGCFETFADGFDYGGGSMTHAWSAHPLGHFARTLGGVRQTAPKWAAITFEPLLDLAEVSECSVSVPTPHGLIHSEWKRVQDAATVRLTLPPNVAADVRLPGVNLRTTEDGFWTIPVTQLR